MQDKAWEWWFRVMLVGWLLALTCVVVAAMPKATAPISFGATTPFPSPPPDAGLSLVENGQGPSPTWQVPPQHVSTWTDVYINASTGSSSNLGTTLMSPWASNADLAKAVGVYGLLSPPKTTPTPPAGGQWVTVHYEGAMPTDFLNLQFVLDANICLHFVGTDLITTLHTGTITAATPYTNTNVLGSVTDTGIADWTPYVGKRIHWLTGSAAGAYSWVGKDLGGGQARISDPFMIFDVTLTGRSFPQEVPPSTGTYVVQDLPELFIGNLMGEATKQGNQVEPFVEFLHLSLPATSTIGAFPQPIGTIDWNMMACSVGWQEPIGAVAYGMYGCCFPHGQIATGQAFIFYINCCFFEFMGVLDDSYADIYDTLGMGCGLAVLNGSLAEINNLAIDTPVASYPNTYGDGVTTVKPSTAPGTIVSWGQGYFVGTGISGVGIRVNAGTTAMFYYQIPTITGAGGDFALDNKITASSYSDATGTYSAGASIATTWANMGIDVTSGGFRNPNDHSNAGAHSPGHDAHLLVVNP